MSSRAPARPYRSMRMRRGHDQTLDALARLAGGSRARADRHGHGSPGRRQQRHPLLPVARRLVLGRCAADRRRRTGHRDQPGLLGPALRNAAGERPETATGQARLRRRKHPIDDRRQRRPLRRVILRATGFLPAPLPAQDAARRGGRVPTRAPKPRLAGHNRHRRQRRPPRRRRPRHPSQPARDPRGAPRRRRSRSSA